MGLKWFRARLSMKKEAAKVPAMAGLYRRYSDANSPTIWKNEIVAVPPSIVNDSTSMSDKRVQYDRLKADLTSKLSSSIITESEKTVVKNHGKQPQPQIRNRAIRSAESSTSSKDPNIKEQSLTRDEKSNKINNQSKDQSNITDNELVI